MNDIWTKERIKEQNEDLKTKSDKGIKVEMTDKEYSKMTLLALKVGFNNAGELLEAFVGDLTGWHIKGSDESHMAQGWYDRAFGIWREVRFHFRYYIYKYDINIDDLTHYEEYFEEVYSEYMDKYPYKEHDSKKECLDIIKELQVININK